MYVLFFLLPWLLVGIGVLAVGFRGSGSARRAVAGTSTGFKLVILVIYLGVGLTVPAIVLANRQNAEGATNHLETVIPSSELQRGKTLFRSTCASCHTLAAVNARGVIGPDLDRIGLDAKGSMQRVLNAIRIGGTGQNRMPSGLLQGSNARAVAAYVSTVAGR
jgi:mono/diheme cytochrome c family protein